MLIAAVKHPQSQHTHIHKNSIYIKSRTIPTDPVVLRNSVRFFRFDFDLIDFAMVKGIFLCWVGGWRGGPTVGGSTTNRRKDMTPDRRRVRRSFSLSPVLFVAREFKSSCNVRNKYFSLFLSRGGMSLKIFTKKCVGLKTSVPICHATRSEYVYYHFILSSSTPTQMQR